MFSVIGSDARLTPQTIGPGATVLAVVLTMLLGTVGHASADDGRRIAWSLTSCDAVIAMIPVDRAVLEDVVPEGFTVGVPGSVRVQLPPDPRMEAVFGLEVLRCASGTGLRGGVGGMTYASYWTFAEPPAELRKPGYDLSFVKWDTLVPDDDRRAVLVDHGIPARDGEVSFDVFHPDGSTVGALGSGGAAGPAGVTFDVSLRFADGETSRFTGTGTIETDFRGSFVEYTPTDAGLASWTTNYRSRTADAGTGVVRLDPDGFPARIVGASAAQAYFLVATGVYFTGGTISLPPEMHSGTSEAPTGSSSVAGALHRDAAGQVESCLDAGGGVIP